MDIQSSRWVGRLIITCLDEASKDKAEKRRENVNLNDRHKNWSSIHLN